MTENRLDLAREDKFRACVKEVVERLCAQMVPGAVECLSRDIPYCKGEVTQQPSWGVHPPFDIGLDYEVTIGQGWRASGVDAKCGYQFISVIQSCMRSNYESVALQGRALFGWTDGLVKNALPQSDTLKTDLVF